MRVPNDITRDSKKSLKPFLRWAGGKSQFLNSILPLLPKHESVGTYFEPFLGAAAIFFAFKPKTAKLSDLNNRLIETYQAIKSDPIHVSRHLDEFVERDCENFYYRVRDEYNRSAVSTRQAARFIYLNKACFNGIFRVNVKGQFNVPYGFKKHLAIPTIEELAGLSRALRNVELVTQNYRQAVSSAIAGDFVYLDPPYPPINGSAYFTHYTKERFSDDDQEEVAQTANQLSRKGCLVLITNADTPFVRKLYKGWRAVGVERTRWITSSRHKHKAKELIICNYKIPGSRIHAIS